MSLKKMGMGWDGGMRCGGMEGRGKDEGVVMRGQGEARGWEMRRWRCGGCWLAMPL